MTYLLDTNIISYLLKGKKPVLSRIEELIENKNEILIPSIAYYGIKRGLIASGATTKLNRFLNFASEIGIVELTLSTLDIAAQVYANLQDTGESYRR